MNTIHCDKVEITQLKHWKRKNRKEKNILFKIKMNIEEKGAFFFYIQQICRYKGQPNNW